MVRGGGVVGVGLIGAGNISDQYLQNLTRFPDVEVRGEVGPHDTLLSIAKARRMLGYEPRHSWRDERTS